MDNSKLVITSRVGTNSVDWSLDGSPSIGAESTFRAATFLDGATGREYLAIEHNTQEYFASPRYFWPENITLNGQIYADAGAAMDAINSIDLSLRGTDVLGSLASHTDIKTLDNITVTTPSLIEGGEPVTKTLATIDDIPTPVINESDVTAMFTSNVAVPGLVARMVKYPDKDPFIRIAARDISGDSNPLVLTVERGFGSLDDHTGDNAIPVSYIDGGVVKTDVITISPETQLDQSVITIPPTIKYFDILYWNGLTEDTTSSYWVDISGVYRRFTAANTPISNFALTNWNPALPMTIEGQSVPRSNVAEIVFGAEYDNVTTVPDYVSAYMSSLRYIKYPQNATALGYAMGVGAISLTSIKFPTGLISIAGAFLSGAYVIEEVVLPSTLTTLNGVNSFADAIALKRVDIPTSLVNFGSQSSDGYFIRCTSLTEIQINGFDASLATVIARPADFSRVPNTADCKLYADTAAGAAAFKAKFPRLSNWTVVIN